MADALPPLPPKWSGMKTGPRPLSAERRAEIRKREQAARPGPWQLRDDNAEDGFPRPLWIVEGPDEEPGDLHTVINVGDGETGEFIAHARTDVPDLLAEVDRLRAELADAREAERRSTSTADAAMRGWKKERAGYRRMRLAWQSARRGRHKARAEQAKAHAQREAAVARLLNDLSRCRKQHLRVKADAENGWIKAKDLMAERDRRAEITPTVAAHVLYHFGAGGMEAGSFFRDLILLRADPTNQRLLAASFPAYGEAVRLAQDTEDGIARLRAIAGELAREARQC